MTEASVILGSAAGLLAGVAAGIGIAWRWFTSRIEAKDAHIAELNAKRIEDEREAANKRVAEAAQRERETAALAAVIERNTSAMNAFNVSREANKWKK